MRAGIGVRRILRVLTVAVLLAAAALWAACGGDASSSSPTGSSGASAQELYDRVAAAVRSARSVHVAGSLAGGGQTMKLDLVMAADRGGRGTVDQDGARAELLLVGDDLYVRGDRAVMASVLGTAAAAERVGDRWVRGPAADPQVAALAGLLQMRPFLENLIKVDGKLSRVEGRSFGGTPALALNDDDVEEGGTMYVAAEGSPYPLLLEANVGAASRGSLAFDSWGAPVALTRPQASRVVDVGALAGR